MHRDVLGISEISGRITQTDHINGDKLDNRKENLRRCSPAQNQGNRWKSKQAKTSKYKGVYFCSKLRKFVAYGREGKKNKRLGTFQSEEDAALAYDRWAIGYFGEFARLNFQRWIPTEEEKERMTQ